MTNQYHSEDDFKELSENSEEEDSSLSGIHETTLDSLPSVDDKKLVGADKYIFGDHQAL